MMVSSTKKDMGYELRETEIDGLSDLYFPQEDKDSPVRDVADVLLENGIKKMEQGLTTIEEVLRVTEVYGRNEEEVFVENAG